MRNMKVRVKEDCPRDRWLDAKHGIWFDKKDGTIELPEDFTKATLKMYIKFGYLEEVKEE